MSILRALITGWLIVPFVLFCAQAASGTDAIKIPKIGNGTEVAAKTLPQSGYGKHYAFPSINDWNSLRIRLERGSCFGACPDYSIEIHGDGTVWYNGRRCVHTVGERHSRIPKAQIQDLFIAFERADFFSLLDHYGQGIVDAPGMSLSLQYDRWRKVVLDDAFTTGIPKPAVSLPDLVDRAVKIERWIGNSGESCRL